MNQMETPSSISAILGILFHQRFSINFPRIWFRQANATDVKSRSPMSKLISLVRHVAFEPFDFEISSTHVIPWRSCRWSAIPFAELQLPQGFPIRLSAEVGQCKSAFGTRSINGAHFNYKFNDEVEEIVGDRLFLLKFLYEFSHVSLQTMQLHHEVSCGAHINHLFRSALMLAPVKDNEKHTDLLKRFFRSYKVFAPITFTSYRDLENVLKSHRSGLHNHAGISKSRGKSTGERPGSRRALR